MGDAPADDRASGSGPDVRATESSGIQPLKTTPDLSPAAVAASALSRVPEHGPTPAPVSAVVCPPPRIACDEDLEDPAVRQAEARLDAYLAQAAAAVPHLSERPPPKLQRSADGTYRFDNAAIGAVIHGDGRVEFEDKAGQADMIPTSGSFDITRFAEKHVLGNPIASAEKAWFLRETEDLRLRLADAYREETLVLGARTLRARLIAVLEDPTRSHADKRAQVFAAWDTCSQDEVGARGQRVIEALVRERMPQGSPLGFGAAELAELNAGRASARAFAPYADVQAGRTPG